MDSKTGGLIFFYLLLLTFMGAQISLSVSNIIIYIQDH